MILIGLCGKAQAGKDTAAAFLVREGWTRVAFADRLKLHAYEINPWIQRPKSTGGFSRLQDIVDSIGWDLAKEAFPEVRKFLQDDGVVTRDVIDQDVWVNAVRDDIRDYTVITDMRFPNEIALVRELGGLVVKIVRENEYVSTAGSHISETAWADVKPDLTIHNLGGLGNLEEQIIAASKRAMLVGKSLPAHQVQL